jgi:hypothetical protein
MKDSEILLNKNKFKCFLKDNNKKLLFGILQSILLLNTKTQFWENIIYALENFNLFMKKSYANENAKNLWRKRAEY